MLLISNTSRRRRRSEVRDEGVESSSSLLHILPRHSNYAAFIAIVAAVMITHSCNNDSCCRTKQSSYRNNSFLVTATSTYNDHEYCSTVRHRGQRRGKQVQRSKNTQQRRIANTNNNEAIHAQEILYTSENTIENENKQQVLRSNENDNDTSSETIQELFQTMTTNSIDDDMHYNRIKKIEAKNEIIVTTSTKNRDDNERDNDASNKFYYSSGIDDNVGYMKTDTTTNANDNNQVQKDTDVATTNSIGCDKYTGRLKEICETRDKRNIGTRNSIDSIESSSSTDTTSLETLITGEESDTTRSSHSSSGSNYSSRGSSSHSSSKTKSSSSSMKEK